jgi:type I site-specific restriction endonuclease
MAADSTLKQMATGSGKTFTAIKAIYRLIKFGKAKRVLFLVDRANLARQALKEVQAFETPDDGRKFKELYNVTRLESNAIDPVNKVVLTDHSNCSSSSQSCIIKILAKPSSLLMPNSSPNVP